ncbi:MULTISPECIES: sigma-70 family RNA polymerase sigma factor [Streptomyces]|uniref:RNA polymerase, sigma-24 subunit, ECF subfamily n=1 Tax=Streptomyces albus (strain ATCC 21838 / DSM 41398 / FERM P-419 / JCM 4703 / NBRC 107858) TaxID=1081613 RepID=A0A0B5ERR6_STRA4|nr:sigma-70 family RNA polymerase sigma factor [Streptomyces sp. SCSIO ZS0520]AJE85518.1 RNA polymerase, sigma-24 subunit, ECF subfamily [Streptomyces albus]AOU79821.1 RNA polymerase, sigma-24 subunit, ECF subfamily [Streptomyces albus]AYN35545.1 DNA-directed RNA polymerase sigma-70 factor [Streptomyces albus]
MDKGEWPALAEKFESQRPHLRAVAYRMLGSVAEADDAVQETWLRLSRSEAGEIGNLGGWLTTVAGRICLDMLRSRSSRREDPLGDHLPEHGPRDQAAAPTDPAHEAQLVDSVGLALLVVLDTLDPAERIAFVLHDMFSVPFGEIAPIVGRTPVAARQLASRARRRVQAVDTSPDSDLPRQRAVVDAFLAAARGGEFEALLALLDPDVVLRVDAAATPAGAPMEIVGAQPVAAQAGLYSGRAHLARTALVDGRLGLATAAPRQLSVVMDFTVSEGRITAMNIIADPTRLAGLDVAILSA